MKKMLMFLVLMVVATVSQSVFAQNSINLVERQVKAASADVDRSTKKFELEKSRKIAELTREAKHQTTVGLRANTSEGRDNAVLALKKLNAQIDSVSKLPTSAEIQAKTKLLADLQQQKKTLSEAQLTAQSQPEKAPKPEPKKETAKEAIDQPVVEKVQPKVDPYNRNIPTRLTRLDSKQRSRSHSTRLDELVIAKVENNLNAAINPSGQQSGYKVIFDNMYIEPVNFVAHAVNGIGDFASMIPPKSMETEYLLPGVYMVSIYINGKRSGEPRKMTIDGQEKKYKGMPCFNYAAAPRFP